MTITGPSQRPGGGEIRLPRARSPHAPFPMMTIRDRHEEEDHREMKRHLPPLWETGKGQHQVDVSRSAVDRSIAGSHGGSIGRAETIVKFENVPKNVKTSAKGDGVFKNMKIQKTPAMSKPKANVEAFEE